MAFGVNYQDPNAQRAYGSPFDTANVAQQGVQNQMAEAQRQDQLMQFLRQFQMQLAQAREQSRQFERQYSLQKHAQRQSDAFQVPKLIGAWSEGILSPISEVVQLVGALQSPDTKLASTGPSGDAYGGAYPGGGLPSGPGGLMGTGAGGLADASGSGGGGSAPGLSGGGAGGGAGDGIGSFLGGGLGIFGGQPPSGTTGGHGFADFLDTMTGGILGPEGLGFLGGKSGSKGIGDILGALNMGGFGAGGDAATAPSPGAGSPMPAPAKLEPMFRKSMSYYDPSRREYVPGVPTDTVGSGASFSDDSALDMADDAIAKGMGADDIVRMVSRYMGGG